MLRKKVSLGTKTKLCLVIVLWMGGEEKKAAGA